MTELAAVETQDQQDIQEPEKEKAAAPALRLCKGQMPAPLVWFIKFHESKENKSEIAKKYFTTPGKIADIQSNANQKYIVEDMLWSEADLVAAGEKIVENFVRGQADEEANPGTVSKRGLATSTAADAQASIESLESISQMGQSETGVTLEQARTAHNDANPRVKKEKETENVESEVDEASLESEDLSEDELLG